MVNLTVWLLFLAVSLLKTDASSSTSTSRRLESLSPRSPSNLHTCRDGGEAYSASWLATREHVVHQFTAFNLSWVNCEMASFIMMSGNKNNNNDKNGSITMTLDVLDLSVIHLSAYERLQRRHLKTLKSKFKDLVREDRNRSHNSLAQIEVASNLAKKKAYSKMPLRNNSVQLLLNSTVVIMPFLASGMGAGHSVVSNRIHYLRACFWSFYTFYEHIAVFVRSEEDASYVKQHSQLPFYAIIPLNHLPKLASLPVATVQTTKSFLNNGTWNFSYIFFTESDQMLIMRSPAIYYSHLLEFPRKLVVPHRLMPYPDIIFDDRHHKKAVFMSDNDCYNASCCLERQTCDGRKGWVHITDPSVSVVSLFNLHVPLGNTNFHQETYRACNFTQERVVSCP